MRCVAALVGYTNKRFLRVTNVCLSVSTDYRPCAMRTFASASSRICTCPVVPFTET